MPGWFAVPNSGYKLLCHSTLSEPGVPTPCDITQSHRPKVNAAASKHQTLRLEQCSKQCQEQLLEAGQQAGTLLNALGNQSPTASTLGRAWHAYLRTNELTHTGSQLGHCTPRKPLLAVSAAGCRLVGIKQPPGPTLRVTQACAGSVSTSVHCCQ